VSKNQTQNVYDGGMLGRRIKFLRGELSQSEFAKKVGVSRAALANYETGRTIPAPEVIEAICDVSGVTSAFLSSGKAREADHILDLLGLNDDSAGSLTADEWAIVRGLRVCKPEVVRRVVALISEGYFENRRGLADPDPILLGEDFRKLASIVEKSGQYQKGAAQENKTQLLLALAQRLVDLRVEIERDSVEGSQ